MEKRFNWKKLINVILGLSIIIVILLYNYHKSDAYSISGNKLIFDKEEIEKINIELQSKDLALEIANQKLDLSERTIKFLNEKIIELEAKYAEKEQKLQSNYDLMEENFRLKVEDYENLYKKYKTYKTWNPFRIGIYSILSGGIIYLIR